MSLAEQLGWDGTRYTGIPYPNSSSSLEPPDVARITDKVEGSHRRFAECRRRFDQLNADLDRAFTRYEEVQAELAEAGTRGEHVMDPPLAAAYGAWKARGPKETRVDLLNITEAPIPAEGDA